VLVEGDVTPSATAPPPWGTLSRPGGLGRSRSPSDQVILETVRRGLFLAADRQTVALDTQTALLWISSAALAALVGLSEVYIGMAVVSRRNAGLPWAVAFGSGAHSRVAWQTGPARGPARSVQKQLFAERCPGIALTATVCAELRLAFILLFERADRALTDTGVVALQ